MNIISKIIISLVISFLLTNLYSRISKTPFISPIQAENIKVLLSNLRFPTYNLTKIFTLKYNPSNTKSIDKTDEDYSFNFPTALITPTISNLTYFHPSPAPSNRSSATPEPEIANGLVKQPKPTNFLQDFTKSVLTSTLTPKPTKKPKPTPTPNPTPITSSQRPGSTLKEIYEDVQKRMCLPAALLYAFQQAETGAWWPVNTPSSKVKIYNKYGWWLDGSGDPCIGMGYHTQTGIVPEDSVNAGVSCKNPIPSGADQAIMGLWQISKYEEEKAKKYLTKIIKGIIDRRVIFDNALIFAVITKNRLGNPPKNCSDWPTDAIKIAAKKHYGSCKDNYCNKVINYYKQYR